MLYIYIIWFYYWMSGLFWWLQNASRAAVGASSCLVLPPSVKSVGWRIPFCYGSALNGIICANCSATKFRMMGWTRTTTQGWGWGLNRNPNQGCGWVSDRGARNVLSFWITLFVCDVHKMEKPSSWVSPSLSVIRLHFFGLVSVNPGLFYFQHAC